MSCTAMHHTSALFLSNLMTILLKCQWNMIQKLETHNQHTGCKCKKLLMKKSRITCSLYYKLDRWTKTPRADNPWMKKTFNHIYSYFIALDKRGYQNKYRIRPNYQTVCLDFQNYQKIFLLNCLLIQVLSRKRSREFRVGCIQWYLCNILLFFFKKTYVVGTHLNCLNLLRQFKWVPTTYVFIKK